MVTKSIDEQVTHRCDWKSDAMILMGKKVCFVKVDKENSFILAAECVWICKIFNVDHSAALLLVVFKHGYIYFLFTVLFTSLMSVNMIELIS